MEVALNKIVADYNRTHGSADVKAEDNPLAKVFIYVYVYIAPSLSPSILFGRQLLYPYLRCALHYM